MAEWMHASMNIGQGSVDGCVGSKEGMVGTMCREMVGSVHRWMDRDTEC